MPKNLPISIIIPTLNEAENLPRLMARIDKTMSDANISYEALLIDDNSKDNTVEVARNLEAYYPIRVQTKRGKRGKAFSLLEGFEAARHPLVAMIDADLQYPPEELAPMYELLNTSQADLIVTNRKQKKVSFIRQLSTKVFNTVFVRALFGVKFDTQSGLKLFRKRMLDSFTMKPSPWSFDLEFIVRAIENKYMIASHDIEFDERIHGETKVRLLNTTVELAKASVDLRWRTSQSRIREGLRANNSFTKQVFGGLALTAATTMLLLVPSHDASALQLSTSSVFDASSRLVQNVRDSITPNTMPANNPVPSPNNTPATPTTTQSSSPNTQSETTTPSTTVAAANTTAGNTSQPIVSTAAATQSTNNPNLAASTAISKNTSVYDSGFPAYTLSASTTNKLTTAALVAFTAALVCILVCGILVSIGIMKRLRLTQTN